MFVLFFPVSTNTVRVLWGSTVLPIAVTVPVLFACITVIPESPGHGTKVCMQMYNTRWISSQCVCRSSQESHTSLKNQQKGREFPQPLGTLCPLKQSPQLRYPLLPNKISSSVHDCNELRLQKSHSLLSAAASASQVWGQAQQQNWIFGLVLAGKAGSLGANWNVSWLAICCQKPKEKCPLAQLPKKKV